MPFVYFGGSTSSVNIGSTTGTVDLSSINEKISKNKNDIKELKEKDTEQIVSINLINNEITDIKTNIKQIKSEKPNKVEQLNPKDIIDDNTIQLKNNKLVAKTLDGLEVTISELNQLKGLKQNIQKQIKVLSKAINLKGKVNSHKDLLLLRELENGDAYIIEKDEDINNSKTWYVWNNKEWICLGVVDVNIRDFITNPIDLNSEVKGILPNDKIDGVIARKSDLKNKLNIEDAYNPENKDVLAKLSENEQGELLFNGKQIQSGDGIIQDNEVNIETLPTF